MVVTAVRTPERLIDDAVASGAVVLVLDGVLRGSVLRAVADAADAAADPAVLVLGPVRPNLEVLVALASRVRGYLHHDSGPETVADAVGALCVGEVVLPRNVVSALVAQFGTGDRGIVAERADGEQVELTHREWEVLVLLRQAHTTTEIAERLVIAPVTVRTHVCALVRKLGARARGDLAAPPPADAASTIREW